MSLLLSLFECVSLGNWDNILYFILFHILIYLFLLFIYVIYDIFVCGTSVYTYFDYIFGELEPIADFKIKSIYLYTGRGNENYKIEKYEKKRMNKMDIKEMYERMVGEEIEKSKNESDIRVRVEYIFNSLEFIQYVCYKRGIELDIENNNFMGIKEYSKEDMLLYRRDIIKPYYYNNNVDKGKNSFYVLFMMESRNISKIKVDGKNESIKLLNYINKLSGPMYDYGILQHNPVKIKWMLMENGLEWEENKKVEIQFINMYLDEEKGDLVEHKFETEDVEDYFITEHMKEVLIKKNSEYGRNIKFN